MLDKYACGFCGSPKLLYFKRVPDSLVGEEHWVECGECFARGPIKRTADEAISSWFLPFKSVIDLKLEEDCRNHELYIISIVTFLSLMQTDFEDIPEVHYYIPKIQKYLDESTL